MNEKIETLTEYPFFYLGNLLKHINPSSQNPINLSIGEPKNSPPQEVLDILNINSNTLSQYPTTKGLQSLREAYCNWAQRRFNLQSPINSETNVLPVAGTREGIFSFIQASVDLTKKNPTIVMPNPFYKIYEGAAHLAGAKTYFVNSESENNFRPDYSSVSDSTWSDCQLLILCSPSNPTGYCLTKEEYKKILALAEKFDFLVCSDECYIDLYPSTKCAPTGLMECCDLSKNESKAVVFHSLSKRSNLAGLRSGFVAANKSIIKKLLLYRTYHGATQSIPSQMASEWAWKEDVHVENNRKDYDDKYEFALNEIDQNYKVIRPYGGFYLWIKLPIDDLTFTKKLYQDHNVIVLPGSYLSVEKDGVNPGTNFIRAAIIHDKETVKKAAFAINDVLNYFTNK